MVVKSKTRKIKAIKKLTSKNRNTLRNLPVYPTPNVVVNLNKIGLKNTPIDDDELISYFHKLRKTNVKHIVTKTEAKKVHTPELFKLLKIISHYSKLRGKKTMKPLFDIDKKTKKEIDTHIKKDNNSYDKFNISDEMLDNVYKIYMNLSVLNNTSDGDKYILDLFKYREFINNVEEFRAEENGTHILVIPVTQ